MKIHDVKSTHSTGSSWKMSVQKRKYYYLHNQNPQFVLDSSVLDVLPENGINNFQVVTDLKDDVSI